MIRIWSTNQLYICSNEICRINDIISLVNEKKIIIYDKELELEERFEVAQNHNVVFLEKQRNDKIIIFTCGHSKASEELQFLLYELNIMFLL